MPGVQEFPKPTIAMIRGYCIGGGLGLAVCCDLRICSDNSRFAVPAAKLGLGYSYAGLRRLVDVVGPAFAREIFFTARQFDAEEARAMGLVNRVVPEAELEAYVKNYAETIAANAPLTVKAVKYIVGEVTKDETKRDLARCARNGGAMLRQQRLHRGPQGVHGEAQTGIHREVMSFVCRSAVPIPGRGGEHRAKQRRRQAVADAGHRFGVSIVTRPSGGQTGRISRRKARGVG